MNVKKVITKLIRDRKEVVVQLHTDIMFYEHKLEFLGDNTELRAKRKELIKTLELDKEGKIRKLEKNQKTQEEISKIDSHLDEIDRTLEQINIQKLKLKDFEIYLKMLSGLDNIQLAKIKNSISLL